MSKPASKTQKSNITATQIRAGMVSRFAAPEWAILWEVGEGTGRHSGRFADAVMMSLWPSRGLELHGVEIKVSRADWKREAADPSKAEAVAQYCDRWWIHTSPGVVADLSEMPPAWGLREFDGKTWRTLKEAEKTNAEPITRPFLAAMLRRADGVMAEMIREAKHAAMADLEAERSASRQRYLQDVEREVARRTGPLEVMKQNHREFREAFGLDSTSFFDYAHLGKAARLLTLCRQGGFATLAARLRAAADEIDAIGALDLLPPAGADAARAADVGSPAVPDGPRPLLSMSSAPKDGTPILARIRADLASFAPGYGSSRSEMYAGLQLVITHRGVAPDGFDPGWMLAGPFGQSLGGDEYFDGWLPLHEVSGSATKG